MLPDRAEKASKKSKHQDFFIHQKYLYDIIMKNSHIRLKTYKI
jgi:hypothetical protein